MSKYWSDFVSRLDPYVPGEQPKVNNLTKLNTNENPYPPSPKVLAAISAMTDARLRLYPPPNAEQLKQTIGDYFGLAENNVFVGNGSDEVLAHIFNAFFRQQKPILFPDISYSFYPVYCGLYGIEFKTPALNHKFEIEAADYLKPNGGIIFPNPNAPTGVLLGLESIEKIVAGNPESVVVVDEAYVDFGGQTSASLVKKYANLLVVQTLSKSRSLAGLRVGFALGSAELIEGLERVKNSFNSYPLGHLALAGAIAAFEDDDYFRQTCSKVIASREKLVAGLEACGFSVLPSAANFVFAKPPKMAAVDVAQKLREHGVIVRFFNKPRIDQYLRITVGTDEENQRLLDVISQQP